MIDMSIFKQQLNLLDYETSTDNMVKTIRESIYYSI